MHKNINSSELSKRVSEKLQLSQADGLELYKELSQLPNGPVKDALDGLLEKMKTDLNALAGQKMLSFAACIRSGSVRDAQYETKFGSDHLNGNAWVDAQGMPLFLEIVEAETPTRAIQIAAIHAKVDPEVIELFQVK